jgi:bisphosphoglycerate-independent phosphoglycerate mutase (AlkP superfamily)
MGRRPLVLTILDGWGYSPAVDGNAIAAAKKPVYDRLLRGRSSACPKGRWATAKWGT